MIKSVLLFAFLFLNTSSFSQADKYDFFTRHKFTFEAIELSKIKNAKVKTRKLYSAYYMKDEQLPDKKTLVEEIKFNKKGNPTEKIFYNSMGGIRTKYNYKYDKNGNLIEEVIIDEYGNVSAKRDISYNSKNDTSKVVIFKARKSTTDKKVFEYYDDGKLKQKLYYDKNDQIYLKEIYTYKNDKLDNIEFFKPDGTSVNKVVFSYNKAGNLAEEKFPQYQQTFTYDNRNRLIRSEGRDKVRLHKYDDNNNMIDDQYFIEKTRRQFKIVFSYFKNGLANEAIRYDALDKKAFYSKYEYEYYK
ncbi:MAG: hypothetical protein AB1521_15770 [Bacteroidota bacterium]